MKRLILITVLAIVCIGLVSAQSTTFKQIVRNTAQDVNGSLWSNSLTHYTEWIDMRDVDSAFVVMNFPDSVCAAWYVENYTDKDGVVSIALNAPAGTGAADSAFSATCSRAFSCSTWYRQGFPLIRIKTIFSASKNHATTSAEYATQFYKYYIKRFRHK